MERGWQIWVDTGGTFTDCLAVAPDGGWRRVKVLSSSALRARVSEALPPRRLRLTSGWAVPDGFFAQATLHPLGGPDDGGLAIAAWDASRSILSLAGDLPAGLEAGAGIELRFPEEAPVLAARLATGTAPGKALPPLALRLATTRGTNALLERRGGRVALFITRGFADLLEIGTQQRPDLFALEVRKPRPLHAQVVEVPERLAADGRVLVPLDLEPLAAPADRLLAMGCDNAAVALLHSFRNPTHEEALATFLRQRGFRFVAASAALAPLIQILPRAETAVVEAYLSPVVSTYLERVERALPAGADAGSLHVMTSAGGLVRAGEFRAADSLLSGPAGGVVGAARAGRRSGLERVLAFDMGGTSTDVARFDGDFEYVFEHRVGAARLVAPALAIESVAAGGGSVVTFDGHRLRVGPESAGARPGPACYGAGGPLTLTDANLLLGRLDPEAFEIPIDRAAAERAAAEIAAEVARGTGEKVVVEALLEGVLAIADERMADAIREISIRRGYDPADYALVAFGGAGGQHVCAVASLLGVATALVPEDAGLLSARGLGAAVVERFAQRQVLRPLDEVGAEVPGWLEQLASEARAAVVREGIPAGEVEVRRRLAALRFVGQGSSVLLEVVAGRPLAAAFAAAYEERFGYRPERRRVEVESLRVVASSRAATVAPAPAPPSSVAAPRSFRSAFLAGAWKQVEVFDRGALPAGAEGGGPALVFEAHSVTLVAPTWRFRVDGAGALVLARREEPG